MYCKNCGKEVAENAIVCPNCGVQIGNLKTENINNETCTMAIIGFVLSFFISIAGLICSIIAYRKCRDENLNGKGFAIAGIAISATSMALAVFFLILFFSILGVALSSALYYY